MPFPDALTLAWVALAALLIAGTMAPLETLGWWAGWYGDPIPPEHEAEAPPNRDRAPAPSPASGRQAPWIVFLSGIHAVGASTYARGEAALIEALRDSVAPGQVVEVFPYSVTNRALTGDRAFAWLWRRALGAKLSARRALQVMGMLINQRNLWQVLVSADRRYGGFYNRGSAELILRTLRLHHYPEASPPPLILLGYSGGAQIAAGAVPFLREQLGARITVVALGGVLAAEPGLLHATRIYDLYGTRDQLRRIAALFFPGRWPLLRWSPWNVAKARGSLRPMAISGCDHTGVHGYLDRERGDGGGRSYFDITLHNLRRIACGEEPEPFAAAGGNMPHGGQP